MVQIFQGVLLKRLQLRREILELRLGRVLFQLAVGVQKIRERLQLQDHALNGAHELLYLFLHNFLPFQIIL